MKNMTPNHKRLQQIPSITELLKSDEARTWMRTHPSALVTDCVRQAVAKIREQALAVVDAGVEPGGTSSTSPQPHAGRTSYTSPHPHLADIILEAARLLQQATAPRVRSAINATGIILHTGLGRAVFSEAVVDSMIPELKGYCTLATDPETGARVERDELVEPLLCELTGAESATVVNNNAAATMLVLAALAARKEVIVSRGQLIEIGGSFRLPEVMAQGGARLVEVGATNRTHLKDYANAITPETAALMRVHPSNFRVIGFTGEVGLSAMAELAHSRGLPLIDDLGAGALLPLEQFGLPHEPTVRESVNAGADVVLFSGDKLIGAAQCGVIVGRKELIARLRKHPLMRAVRVDKTCLMVLERTLQLFRDPDRLRREHPTYRMISTPMPVLELRAAKLLEKMTAAAPNVGTEILKSSAYLGSGSLPDEALPSVMVRIAVPDMTASDLARRFRTDEACVFGRIEKDRFCLDMRTITDEQLDTISAALGRIAG